MELKNQKRSGRTLTNVSYLVKLGHRDTFGKYLSQNYGPLTRSQERSSPLNHEFIDPLSIAL